MTIQFIAHEEFFTFHDPMQDRKLIDRKTEIRKDPLTGETSRIIFDPGAPFVPTDYTELAKETAGSKCPFCPENVQSFTPTFPDNLVEGGRLTKGEAVVFPNLFPYSKHNAVVRMSDQHYVKLKEFTTTMIADAFIAAHAYLKKVTIQDSKTTYASINWNYLPLLAEVFYTRISMCSHRNNQQTIKRQHRKRHNNFMKITNKTSTPRCFNTNVS